FISASAQIVQVIQNRPGFGICIRVGRFNCGGCMPRTEKEQKNGRREDRFHRIVNSQFWDNMQRLLSRAQVLARILTLPPKRGTSQAVAARKRERQGIFVHRSGSNVLRAEDVPPSASRRIASGRWRVETHCPC